MQAEFDQLAPTLLQNLAAHIRDCTVVALLIDTGRAPFVTKNPMKGGKVTLEVPWREGNATRSARREDLLRILVPSSKTPDLELLAGWAQSCVDSVGNWQFQIHLEVYVYAHSETVLVAHRSEVTVAPSQMGFQDHSYIRQFKGSTAKGVSITEHDVLLSRPARIEFAAHGRMCGIGPILPASVTVGLALGVVGALTPPKLSAAFRQMSCSKRNVAFGLDPLVT